MNSIPCVYSHSLSTAVFTVPPSSSDITLFAQFYKYASGSRLIYYSFDNYFLLFVIPGSDNIFMFIHSREADRSFPLILPYTGLPE